MLYLCSFHLEWSHFPPTLPFSSKLGNFQVKYNLHHPTLTQWHLLLRGHGNNLGRDENTVFVAKSPISCLGEGGVDEGRERKYKRQGEWSCCNKCEFIIVWLQENRKKKTRSYLSSLIAWLTSGGAGGREKSQLNAHAHPCPPVSFRLSTVWFLSRASPSCFNSPWKKCFRTYLQRAGCQATALSPRHAPDIEPSSNYNYNPNHKM